MTTTPAITTRFLPPTNHLGARIKASCLDRAARMVHVRDNSLASHVTAATELGIWLDTQERMSRTPNPPQWKQPLACGRLSPSEYVFCFDPMPGAAAAPSAPHTITAAGEVILK